MLLWIFTPRPSRTCHGNSGRSNIHQRSSVDRYKTDPLLVLLAYELREQTFYAGTLEWQ